jgi:hypothetical protein
MKMEVKNGFTGSERKKKTYRGRKLRGKKKKTEVAERKEEREIEKEKG